jgi:hypothetical protein
MSIEEYLCYSGAAIIVVAIIVVLYRRMHPKMKHGEILPADVMKAKYNLTAEHYKPPRLNPERVPHHLRDLLPIAAKWGIGDDIIRDDFQQRAPESEKQELGELLSGRGQAINEWLDSFGGNPMPPEAAAFMYMMLDLDEMGIRIAMTNSGQHPLEPTAPSCDQKGLLMEYYER